MCSKCFGVVDDFLPSPLAPSSFLCGCQLPPTQPLQVALDCQVLAEYKLL